MLQLLSPEHVPIASTDAAQHVGNQVKEIAPQPPTPAQELLGSIRIGWRELAGETAQTIKRLSQATVQQALEIGQRLWRMQKDLKRKEYSYYETRESAHDRLEIRQYWTVPVDVLGGDLQSEWMGLRSIGMVVSERRSVEQNHL